MIVLSLFVMRAVPVASFANASADRSDRLPILADRFFPAFLHLPELPGARFVVGLFAVVRFREIDFLLTAARGDVVRIERQDLLVFLEREIVAAAIVVTVRVGQEFSHFFDLGDELRAHRLVEITGLLQMGSSSSAASAVRIVAIVQNLAAICSASAYLPSAMRCSASFTPLSQKPLTASSCCVAGRRPHPADS